MTSFLHVLLVRTEILSLNLILEKMNSPQSDCNRFVKKCGLACKQYGFFFLTAVCLFGGRELVEGDRKAVRDSSGRCLLFECKVS